MRPRASIRTVNRRQLCQRRAVRRLQTARQVGHPVRQPLIDGPRPGTRELELANRAVNGADVLGNFAPQDAQRR